MKIQRGYIIEFKRTGLTSAILGSLLKLFERSWDGWGWHLAIAWEQAYDGWNILEATEDGVEINYYSDKYLDENTRAYQWLTKVPSRKAMGEFLKSHINKKYDVAIYFWTALAIIIRHYFNHPIPKLLDDRFDCWELSAEFFAEVGEPIQSKYDVIIITDIIKALKGRRGGVIRPNR